MKIDIYIHIMYMCQCVQFFRPTSRPQAAVSRAAIMLRVASSVALSGWSPGTPCTQPNSRAPSTRLSLHSSATAFHKTRSEKPLPHPENLPVRR